MKKKKSGCADFEHAFYGSGTIGERGQVVIPAEARAELGFQPGDKVLMMRHPHAPGLMLFKFDSVREVLDDYVKQLQELDAKVQGDEI